MAESLTLTAECLEVISARFSRLLPFCLACICGWAI